ncbi:hypothetical protein FBUS_03403 [Fasciolopsis buskii]|uniref:Uncharacterized protein n=1 Tax=Fasciolopsis buskii TaxID=27845 RepID=A0A8E0RWB2_9TREM|nr:hypothetical protein FBUS_03403 [Fasciolopsis buski]
METTNTVRMSLMQGAFRTDTTLSAWRNYLSNSFVHDFNRWMSLNTHTRRDIRFSQIHLLVYEFTIEVEIPSKQSSPKYLIPWSKGLMYSFFSAYGIRDAVLNYTVKSTSTPYVTSGLTLEIQVAFDFATLYTNDIYLSNPETTYWFARSVEKYYLLDRQPRAIRPGKIKVSVCYAVLVDEFRASQTYRTGKQYS